LRKDFLGVRAVPEQRDHGNEHGQHGHRDGDRREALLVCGFLGVFVQLLQLVGHGCSWMADTIV
jgi:hypothetical protein